MSNIPLIVTHDGDFHADEVVGVSLIQWTFGKIELIRTRDPEIIEQADFVLDVGGVYAPQDKRFDHHQKTYEGRLASAGMVLMWLTDNKFLPQNLSQFFYDQFIKGVDEQDTGAHPPEKGICTFSDIVKSYNPMKEEIPPEEQREYFLQAVDFSLAHLHRLKDRFNEREALRSKFRSYTSQLNQMPSGILVLEERLPWKEYILEESSCNEVKFVVMPETRDKWLLYTVPNNDKDLYSSRLKLPSNWAGLLEGELVEVSGIDGAIFCHKQRFIAAFKNKESALKAAEYSLSTYSEQLLFMSDS